jgi:hypothetical protein
MVRRPSRLILGPFRVDTSGVDGGFNFGEPAKRPAKLGGPRGPRSGGSFDVRIVWVAAGLAVAAMLAFVFLRGAGEAGERIADARSDTVAQVDRAQDVAAQASIARALTVARTLYAEQGTFAADQATLTAFDPSIHFISGASTGPTSIAYRADGSSFGVAVRSASGTCWWAKAGGNGTTAYGSGGTCTGQAALAASDPSW